MKLGTCLSGFEGTIKGLMQRLLT